MHAAPGQRVQHRGQRGHQRLAFAGFHLRDFAVVQHHAADELHVKMPHLQKAPSSLAHQCKRGHNRRLQRRLQHFAIARFRGIGIREALLHFRAQRGVTRLQLFIAERLRFRLRGVDGRHEGLQFFYVALVLRADEARHHAVKYLSCFHEGLRRLLTVPICKLPQPRRRTWRNILF